MLSQRLLAPAALCVSGVLLTFSAQAAASEPKAELPSPLSNPDAQADASLAPVVVSATRSARILDETPVRVEVVDRKEIERTNAHTLKQALENVPGLQVREVRGKSGYELSLQGLSADQVLVLIDGLPITASTASTVDLSQYLIDQVEHIEVIKGASSAQYGSSAMGGVINVITRRAAAGFGGTAAFDVGSYGKQNDNGKSASANNRNARFNLNGGDEHWRLGLSGQYSDEAGFGVEPSEHTRQGDASRRQQLALKGEWLPAKHRRVWAEASHYSEDDTQRYNLAVPPILVPQRKLEDISRERLSAGSNWRFDNGIRAEIKGVDERYKSHSPAYSNGYLATERQASQHTQHISGQLDLPAYGQQLWTVGADWHRESLKQTSNGLSELAVLGDVSRSSRELFVQNDIFFGDKWELLLGLRGQHDSDFGGHWAPKASLRGTVLDADGRKGVVRASLGQGYRVPNLKERHYLFDHSNLGYKVAGNPNLQPESSTSLQVGGTLSQGRDWSVDVNAFYNRVSDLIQEDLANATVTGGITTYSYSNVSRARTAGVETSLTWQPIANWDLSAAYTYTRTRDRNTGLDLTRRPKSIVRLGADWQALPSTALSARLRYQSEEMVDSVSQARSPAWATLDVSLNHQVNPSSTLVFGINNLSNRQRHFADANDYGPIAGRYIYIGAKFAFGNAR